MLPKQRFVTHLESAWDGTPFDADSLQTVHADRPLWVRYDIDSLRDSVPRDVLCKREHGLWRYRELLPLPFDEEPVTLHESITPLIDCSSLAKDLGIGQLLIKDESRLPTNSFKSRGMTMAVSMANRFGITRVAVPTAGNAGGALAAYAARAGMECFVFMPRDTPRVNQFEAALHGAHVVLVDGLIGDCGRIVRSGTNAMQWFDVSTLREPYRIEGKKTMGLELAEQMNWSLPDAIFYPTGGGTGLIGMWKAFGELRQLGWLESERQPRMYACQSSGCAPIVKAFDAGERTAAPTADPDTIASGIRVPAALGDFMILDAVRASGGAAFSAPESALVPWMYRVASDHGISLCPESAACCAALEIAARSGTVRSDDTVVVFNTGAAQKYPDIVELRLPEINPDESIDWTTFDQITHHPINAFA